MFGKGDAWITTSFRVIIGRRFSSLVARRKACATGHVAYTYVCVRAPGNVAVLTAWLLTASSRSLRSTAHIHSWKVRLCASWLPPSPLRWRMGFQCDVPVRWSWLTARQTLFFIGQQLRHPSDEGQERLSVVWLKKGHCTAFIQLSDCAVTDSDDDDDSYGEHTRSRLLNSTTGWLSMRSCHWWIWVKRGTPEYGDGPFQVKGL